MTTVELDGLALEVQSASAWQEIPGVAPYVADIEVRRDAAEELFGKAQRFGSRLTFTEGGTALTISRLTILGTSPTNNIGTAKVRLADPRWTWPYRFVARNYNIRRKSPNTRAGSSPPANLPGDVRGALRVVVDNVVYAKWSLKPTGEAFSAADVVRDVLDTVAGRGNWEDPDGVLGENLPDIEGLSLNAQGDTAVGQVLSAIGGGVGIT